MWFVILRFSRLSDIALYTLTQITNMYNTAACVCLKFHIKYYFPFEILNKKSLNK